MKWFSSTSYYSKLELHYLIKFVKSKTAKGLLNVSFLFLEKKNMFENAKMSWYGTNMFGIISRSKIEWMEWNIRYSPTEQRLRIELFESNHTSLLYSQCYLHYIIELNFRPKFKIRMEFMLMTSHDGQMINYI